MHIYTLLNNKKATLEIDQNGQVITVFVGTQRAERHESPKGVSWAILGKPYYRIFYENIAQVLHHFHL